MTTFDVLATQRAIRNDAVLSSTQKALLWAATLRADSDSQLGRAAGRVRASLELLAKDAGYSSKSTERAFKDEHVLAYFARVQRETRKVGLWFRPTPDRESGVTPDRESGVATTPDTVSTTPDRESDHLPSHLPTSKQPTRKGAKMDDATWLAAELDADPAACRAAIERKQQQATDRGDPWRSVRKMVREVIPLDEWEPLVRQAKQPPARPRLVAAQCTSTRCPGTRHEWTDRNNRLVCMGA